MPVEGNGEDEGHSPIEGLVLNEKNASDNQIRPGRDRYAEFLNESCNTG
jgi:hypothetical protein